MAEIVKERDFIELEYTGKLTDGTIFDTTSQAVAKENDFHHEKMKYGPVTICVGEKQLLPGLDDVLKGKELGQEFEVKLAPEKAFGKRDIKKIRVIPISTFYEHDLQPQRGLEINVDGESGIVTSVSGGRIIVNFNHPLAGREVIYTIRINKKITDKKEQVISFVSATFRLQEDKVKVEIEGDKAVVELPLDLPAPITDMLIGKLTEIVGLNEVEFKKARIAK